MVFNYCSRQSTVRFKSIIQELKFYVNEYFIILSDVNSIYNELFRRYYTAPVSVKFKNRFHVVGANS